MSLRSMTCRFAFVACAVLGVACANVIGTEGFWWKTGASQWEVWRKYDEDAADYNAKPEEFRKATYFFDYTDVKQSRVHGWPFPCLWCDVMTTQSRFLGLRVRATPWLFDGAPVFEVRVWPLLADISVAILIVAATCWAASSYLRKGKAQVQFIVSSLLGIVLAVVLTLWIWLPRERFEHDDAKLFHYFGAAKEWMAWLGWHFAIVTTFVGLTCMILAALHVVMSIFSRPRKMDADLASSEVAV